MTWVLSAVMCLAVGTMLAWHLWSVAQGETSVEGHDHDVYRRVARERGEVRAASPSRRAPRVVVFADR